MDQLKQCEYHLQDIDRQMAVLQVGATRPLSLCFGSDGCMGRIRWDRERVSDCLFSSSSKQEERDTHLKNYNKIQSKLQKMEVPEINAFFVTTACLECSPLLVRLV